MTKDELIERLADIEHQRWSDWQKWVHSLNVGDENSDASDLVVPGEHRAHWDRLIATPYADLPEHSKESDRDQVARYWPLLVEFVAEWIMNNVPDYPEDNAGSWLSEMT